MWAAVKYYDSTDWYEFSYFFIYKIFKFFLDFLDFLAKNKVTNERGGPDDVTLALVMAVIYAIDLSSLQKHEDYNELIKRVPMLHEINFAESVIKALAFPWECDGLLGFVKFAMGISIATLR